GLQSVGNHSLLFVLWGLFLVNIMIPDLETSGNIDLFFQDKDISPPEVTGISSDEPGIIGLEFNSTIPRLSRRGGSLKY
ncbi:MAG: hypothetical protein KAR31_10220, partial [Candidatus Omnitrophica bacterium]|nr:hypothetical protein [Candidatus Omnitrophota bacterium]